MQDKFELSLLTDYYGAFLSENQRELILMSADEDLSLSEIAQQRGISKQGVRDALICGENKLCDMEAKLGLIKRDKKLIALLEKLKTELNSLDTGSENSEKIKVIITEITKIAEGKDGV